VLTLRELALSDDIVTCLMRELALELVEVSEFERELTAV
jgi:hypothetical protein